jgi:hypothetical protein
MRFNSNVLSAGSFCSLVFVSLGSGPSARDGARMFRARGRNFSLVDFTQHQRVGYTHSFATRGDLHNLVGVLALERVARSASEVLNFRPLGHS